MQPVASRRFWWSNLDRKIDNLTKSWNICSKFPINQRKRIVTLQKNISVNLIG